MYFPADEVTDMPEEQWVAELVREQLLAVTRDELPYSIATRVTEWEWPRIRVDIIVERESQKGMVIGKGGQRAEGGRHARCASSSRDGAYLELRVQGRQGLAAPSRPRRAPRLLTRTRRGSGGLGRRRRSSPAVRWSSSAPLAPTTSVAKSSNTTGTPGRAGRALGREGTPRSECRRPG